MLQRFQCYKLHAHRNNAPARRRRGSNRPLYYFFAFNPISTSRRIASGRVRSGSFLSAIYASNLASGLSHSNREPPRWCAPKFWGGEGPARARIGDLRAGPGRSLSLIEQRPPHWAACASARKLKSASDLSPASWPSRRETVAQARAARAIWRAPLIQIKRPRAVTRGYRDCGLLIPQEIVGGLGNTQKVRLGRLSIANVAVAEVRPRPMPDSVSSNAVARKPSISRTIQYLAATSQKLRSPYPGQRPRVFRSWGRRPI
jgi:hypothetical protein